MPAIMSNLPLPLSQPTHTSRLFSDEYGRPLSVFVEASLVYGYKTVRLLRREGAVICHHPNEAQIIIVDPENEAGAQMVQEWASELGKVVLHFNWVRICVEQGHVLLRREDWGDMRLPHGTYENEHTDIEHPLPTPRQTPPEAGPSNYTPSQITVNETVAMATFLLQQARSNSLAFSQPGLSTSQVYQPQSSAGYGAVYSPSAFAAPPGQTTPQTSVPGLPAEIVANALELLNSGGFNFSNQLQEQSRPTNFNQGSPMQQLPGYTTLSQPSTQFTLAATNFMDDNTLQYQSPSSSSNPTNYYPQHTPLSVSHGRLSSLKRKSLSDPSSFDGTQKQPRTSSSPDPGFMHTPPLSEPRVAADVQSELFTNAAGEQLQFYVQMEINSRSRIVKTLKLHGGKVISDIPKADYAVLSRQSKMFTDLLRSCLIAETTAVQAQWVFESVGQGELLDEEQYSFEGVPLRSRRGRLLADQSPAGNGTRKSGKGKSTPKAAEKASPRTKKASSTSKASASIPKASASTLKTPATSTSKTPASTSKSSASPTKAAAKRTKNNPVKTASNHSPPSPPPPIAQVERGEGKFRFTTDEHDYFRRYLPILMARDPDITRTAIAGKLHEKMPSHTKASWTSTIGKHRDFIDGCRKRAHIARRVRGSTQSSSNLEPSSPPSEPVPIQRTPSPAPSHDDFQQLAGWLANGGADNLRDEEVWTALAQQYTWHAAEEWEEFWNSRGDEINVEVQRRVQQQQDLASSQVGTDNADIAA